MHDNIKQKTIVLTGASSGFGFLTTQLLLKKRYSIIALIRGGEKRGEEIFSQILTSENRHLMTFVDCELTDVTSVQRAVGQIKSLCPEGIDVLINNAGSGVLGPVELQSEQKVREQFELNFFAPLRLIQTLLPLIRKKQGRILNVSSLVSYNVFPFYGTYAASKHAIDALTEALFYDLESLGVQVCSIQPGGFKTRFTGSAVLIDESHAEFPVYASRIARFKKALQFLTAKVEKDPQQVAMKVAQLVDQSRIPLRVQIGSDAKFNWYLAKILPDRCRVLIQNWLYKRFLF